MAGVRNILIKTEENVISQNELPIDSCHFQDVYQEVTTNNPEVSEDEISKAETKGDEMNSAEGQPIQMNRKPNYYSGSTGTVKRKKVSCYICGVLLASQYGLNRHLRTHAKSKKPFKCSSCDQAYAEFGQLKSHLVTEHSDLYTIEGDGSNLHSTLQEIRRTIGSMESIRVVPLKFRCSFCPKTFAYRTILRQHYVTDHQNNKPYVCKTCGSKYKNHCDLRYHELSQQCQSVINTLATRLFKCDHCNLSFKAKQNLYQHVRKSHREQQERKKQYLTCLFCSYKAASSNLLEIHNRIHTGVNPFSCTACGKAYASRSYLFSHIRKSCPEAKAMGLEAELPKLKPKVNKPQEAGDPQEVFNCSLCIQTFRRLAKKIEHEKSHGDTCPCPFCPTAFKSKSGLFSHKVKAHPTKIENFNCTDCTMTYFTSKGFEQHKQKKHGPHSQNSSGILDASMILGLETDLTSDAQCNQEVFKCSKCIQTFGTVHLRDRHVQSHGVRFPCRICVSAFNNKKTMYKHRAAAHPNHVGIRKHLLHVNRSHKKAAPPAVELKHVPIPITVADILTEVRHVPRKLETVETEILITPDSTNDEKADGVAAERGVLKCSQCSQTFATLNLRDRHEKSHGVRFPCRICLSAFNNKTTLYRHIATIHSNHRGRQRHLLNVKKSHKKAVPPPAMEHPPINVADPSSIPCVTNGVKAEVEEEAYDLDALTSAEIITDEIKIEIEAEAYDLARPFSLEISTCTNEDPLSNLLQVTETTGRSHKTEEFKCSKCIQTFRTIFYRSLHEESHGVDWPCPFCTAAFKHKNGLYRHRSAAHQIPKEVKLYQCNICRFTFLTRKQLAEHKGKVHKVRHGNKKTPVTTEQESQDELLVFEGVRLQIPVSTGSNSTLAYEDQGLASPEIETGVKVELEDESYPSDLPCPSREEDVEDPISTWLKDISKDNLGFQSQITESD